MKSSPPPPAKERGENRKRYRFNILIARRFCVDAVGVKSPIGPASVYTPSAFCLKSIVFLFSASFASRGYLATRFLEKRVAPGLSAPPCAAAARAPPTPCTAGVVHYGRRAHWCRAPPAQPGNTFLPFATMGIHLVFPLGTSIRVPIQSYVLSRWSLMPPGTQQL